MSHPRDTFVTGIGLVSSLGEGLDEHWAALHRPGGAAAVLDNEHYAPFMVHPLKPLELDRQIPKKGDQRQMEPWQRIGVYAAGLALDAAGMKGNAELLGRTDMIVAAGGGERDQTLDETLLADLPRAADPAIALNARLAGGLRPTLFLAQLSNLLAGNISIVHGVVGSSRSLMGEEAAGVDAVRIACARIAAGQSELALVGGSYNAERPETLLIWALGRTLLNQPFAPIAARQARGGGMVMASLGCFLIVESRAHAEARGAAPLARIAGILSDRSDRTPGAAAANARRQFDALRSYLQPGASAVLSGATGVAAPTAEELAFLRDLGMPFRATGSALGHSVEPSFPANLALAALAVSRGTLFDPLETTEAPMDGALQSAIVTSWGAWRGEGMAAVVPA